MDLGVILVLLIGSVVAGSLPKHLQLQRIHNNEQIDQPISRSVFGKIDGRLEEVMAVVQHCGHVIEKINKILTKMGRDGSHGIGITWRELVLRKNHMKRYKFEAVYCGRSWLTLRQCLANRPPTATGEMTETEFEELLKRGICGYKTNYSKEGLTKAKSTRMGQSRKREPSRVSFA